MLNSRNGGDPVDGLKVVTSFNNYVSADGYSKNRADKIVLAAVQARKKLRGKSKYATVGTASTIAVPFEPSALNSVMYTPFVKGGGCFVAVAFFDKKNTVVSYLGKG